MEEISRQRFMKSVASLSLGSSVCLNLPILEATPKTKTKAQAVIYLYMSGGLSHIDTFDPKPGSDTQGPVKAIKTKTGELISEYMPLMAKNLDKCAVIRSMTTKEGDHNRGDYLMHTSYRLLSTTKHPALGSWILREAGANSKYLPGWIKVGGGSNHDHGFFSNKYSGLHIPKASAGIKDIALPKDVDKRRFMERMKILRSLEKDFQKKYDNKNLTDYGKVKDDAIRLMFSKDVEAFNLSNEKASTMKMYGNNEFAKGCVLARRLVQRGVRFVEVNMGGWDMHQSIFDSMETRAAILDRAMAALLVDLKRRNMLSKTLVVLSTEFGRTPRINGNMGRDHHIRSFSTVLAGAGINQGIIYGKTDKKGMHVEENPVSVADFNATIAAAMGIKHNAKAISPDGRPFFLSNQGKPIMDLLA